MTLDESTGAGDHIDEAYGVKLVADKQFAQYLEGAVINFIENENGSGFQIATNVQSDCCSSCSSCGSDS